MALLTMAILTMATLTIWQVRTALEEQGLTPADADVLFSTLALKDLDALAKVLGDDSAAVRHPLLTPPRSTPDPALTQP